MDRNISKALLKEEEFFDEASWLREKCNDRKSTKKCNKKKEKFVERREKEEKRWNGHNEKIEDQKSTKKCNKKKEKFVERRSRKKEEKMMWKGIMWKG